jgi:6-phosphogluconate dehydrogenase
MSKSFFGVIGLGVMGKSLSINIAEKGFDISVFNRTDFGEEKVVVNFIEENTLLKNLFGFTDLEKFVASLQTPRRILIMIKAGNAIDSVIEQLIPLLSEGDIIIDGGNSHYIDTAKRHKNLQSKKLYYLGCGISGGEEGARKGPSMMPGGTFESYKFIAPILEKISAKDKNNQPCCTYVGPEGSGHFVKMVHNGIEYAEMQLLAEVYAMLKNSRSNLEIAEIFSQWNSTDLSSYLLEITIDILKKKEGKDFLLDKILDKAENKGTGSWSSKTAFNLGGVNTMMSSSVFARYISSFKDKRIALSNSIAEKTISKEKPHVKTLENAYRFARIINHHQGFELMRLASLEYHWNLNLSEIARIWTNGCIIRSKFIEKSVEIFKENDNYFDDKNTLELLKFSEESIKESITLSLKQRIAFDAFWAAYNYWISMTTKNLPANLIQAQRDYFGAHTYQLKNDDSAQNYHTNWLKK